MTLLQYAVSQRNNVHLHNADRSIDIGTIHSVYPGYRYSYIFLVSSINVQLAMLHAAARRNQTSACANVYHVSL